MDPNQFTETTNVGYGSRIMSAIVGVPIGLLLIFGSCALLYWNEGRTDYSKIAKKSVPVQAQQVDQSQNGKFVSVTGSVEGQQISDGTYLKPGSYVAVQRIAEEYAWVEKSESSSNSNTGGSQTNTTTYTYSQQWVNNPEDSSRFHHPEGHQNLPKQVSDSSVQAKSGKVGAYSFDPQTIKLPSLKDVQLSTENTILPSAVVAPKPTVPPAPPSAAPGAVVPVVPAAAAPAASQVSAIRLASAQYLYSGSTSLASPQLGDERVSFKALPSGTNVTIFGQSNNGTLAAYTDPNNHTLYRLLDGDRQTAIATMHNQYQTTAWILRAVGIGLIWIGLMMLLAPLDVLLDFLPIAGSIGRALSGIITFPIALVLGGTVILISYTLHHVLALLIAVPVVLGIVIGILKLVKHGRGLNKSSIAAKLTGTPPPASPVAATNPTVAPGSGSLFAPSVPLAQPSLPVQTIQAPQPVQAPQTIAPTPPAVEPVQQTQPQPVAPVQTVQPTQPPQPPSNPIQ
jgi:hypothetical protein